MPRLRLLTALAAVAATAIATAQTPKVAPKTETKSAATATLAATQGAVAKVEKDSLTIRPRGADGRFEKELVLQVTGSSHVTVLTYQTRAGKSVPVQQEMDVKDLKPQQSVAVIYTPAGSGPVLLSAVALSAK